MGVVLTAVLAVFGAVFTEEVAVPPAGFGLTAGALLGDLVLVLTNFFGGYVGGLLGTPTRSGSGR